MKFTLKVMTNKNYILTFTTIFFLLLSFLVQGESSTRLLVSREDITFSAVYTICNT